MKGRKIHSSQRITGIGTYQLV